MDSHYSVYYQVKKEGTQPPINRQDESIQSTAPPWIPLPGDSIDLQFNDEYEGYIVLSRHFSFFEGNHTVHIMLRHATVEEIACRINR